MKNKILTLIPSLYGGGAEKFAADISYTLTSNYDHQILLYNKKDGIYDYSADLVQLDIPKRRTVLGRVLRQIEIFKKISNFKKVNRPEITISHMLMANMLNIITRKQDKIICILHGEWSVKTGKSKLLDKLVEKIYSKADMIISVSYHIQNVFQEYYNIDTPHEVIYIGIDVKDVQKKASEKLPFDLPEKFIVYVAGFRPVKNHIQLLEQMEVYLKTNDTHLVLLGDGELRSEIEETIERLKLVEKVILLGNLANPYPVIKNAELSLVVSSSESFSLVVIESMALGVPVISTDCGGPRELIEPEWNKKIVLPHQTKFGILVKKPEKWNEKTLIDEIDRLLNNKALRDEISKNGKDRANYFDISKSEDKLVKLINGLIKNDK